MYKLFPFSPTYTLIFGKKGSGKTSLLAGIAYSVHKYNLKHNTDYIVYCTEPEIAYTYYLPYQDIGHYWLKPFSFLLIDEMATLFNSRDFKTTPKAVRDYFRYTRHNQICVISMSQQFNDCDLQLRSQADRLFLAKRFYNYSIYRRIEKECCLVTNQDGRGEISESFVYTPFFKSGSFFLCSLKKYRKFFDSYSKLPLPDIDNSNLIYNDYILPGLPVLSDQEQPEEKKKRVSLGSRVFSPFKKLFTKKTK